MRKVVCLFPLIIALAHGSCFATAVANAWSTDEIVSATDSRITNVDGAVLADICKIRSAGGLHFTLIGQAGSEDADFVEIIQGILATRRSLPKKVKAIQDRLEPLLNRALQTNAGYRGIASKQGAILSVVIYGFSDGKLVLHDTRFAVRELVLHDTPFAYNDSIHVSPENRECPGVDCPSGRAVILAPTSGNFDWNADQTATASSWVEEKIKEGHFDIGGPLEVIRIDRTGNTEWIKKPEVCKDQE